MFLHDNIKWVDYHQDIKLMDLFNVLHFYKIINIISLILLVRLVIFVLLGYSWFVYIYNISKSDNIHECYLLIL
jgi:hypothetical protein